MSLIRSTIVLNSTEDKQRSTRDQISRQLTSLFDHMIATHRFIFGMVWENQYGLSPAEVLEVLGTDAAQVFQLAGLSADLLNTIQAGAMELSAPVELEFHEDGTITIKPPAETPEAEESGETDEDEAPGDESVSPTPPAEEAPVPTPAAGA